MNIWLKEYDAFHLSNLPKYKDKTQLDYYVYDRLIDTFAKEHNIIPSDISFSKDRLIYKENAIGACSLNKTGYKYVFTVSVTDEFKEQNHEEEE